MKTYLNIDAIPDGAIPSTKLSSGSGGDGGGAYREVLHGTNDTTFTLTPNTFHVWDEVGTLDLSLGDGNNGVANEYLFQFTSGGDGTTLVLNDDIKWTEDLVIETYKIYQISVLNGLGTVLSWNDNGELDTTLITFYVNDTAYNAEAWMTWGDFINSDYNTIVPYTSDKWFVEKDGYPAYAILYDDEIDIYENIYIAGSFYEQLSNKIVPNQNYIAS